MAPATTDILVFSFAILSIFYYWFQRKFSYWRNKNIPCLRPVPIFGNYAKCILQKKNLGQMTQSICKELPDEPLIGAFYGTQPVLIPQDPEIIKLITTKDFYYFNGRELCDYSDREVLTRSLFFTHGDQWKVLRQNLTPIFSSAKMKNMFHLIKKCSEAFEKMMNEETLVSNVLEVRSLMARYTVDCICACTLGIESDVMSNTTKNNPFRTITDLMFVASRWKAFISRVRQIWPEVFYGLGFKIFPKKLDEFFSHILMNVMKQRNHEPSHRQDFVDLMLMLKKNNYITGDKLTNAKDMNKEKIQLKIDDELLVSQSQIFFAGGFETSSSTLSFTLYELAKNQQCQKIARKEINAYLRNQAGILNYDCVSKLPYLEQCVDESLRLYPVFDIVTRELRDTYVLPNGAKLEKGVGVHIPILHMHYDPKYFPEPKVFRPERFSPEERRNIKPYTYLPFGEGPRNCIGMRFAKMQMMPGLITILKNYRLHLAEGMPLELQFDPTSPVLQSKSGIHLHFTKI